MDWLIWLHVAAMLFWLGSDVAIYSLSGAIVDPGRPFAVRAFAASSRLRIEMLPRIALIIALGSGLALMIARDTLPGGLFAQLLVILATGIWLALNLAVHLDQGGRLGLGLTIIDSLLRSILLLALLWLAIAPPAFTGLLDVQNWLRIKLGLFALILAAGLGIRWRLRRFATQFAQLAQGLDTQANAELHTMMAQIRPLVWSIWVSLLASLWLGLSHTTPWH